MHRRFRFPRPRSGTASLLANGVRPRAIAAGPGPGNAVRVALRTPPAWDELLGDLAGIGPVWRITRNRHASLGLREDGGYPRLHFSPNGLLAVDAAGSLAADFSAWGRAWAVEATPPCGHRVHAAEFEDARGDVFHKVCLPGNVPPARFAAWARAWQADGIAEVPCAAAPREPGPVPPGTLHLAGALLRDIVLSAAEAGIALRAAVHADGLSQRGEIRPAQATESGGWLRLLGDGAALFVEAEPDGLLRVEPQPVEGEAGWSVALVHPDGRRWLELAAGPDDLRAWNSLVSDRLLRGPGIGR